MTHTTVTPETLARVAEQIDRAPASGLDGLLAALRRAAPSPDWDFAGIREDFERIAAGMDVPEGVRCVPTQVADRPAELIVPEAPLDRTCVYLHGGAFTIGSIDTVRPLAARFARAVRARTLVLDYRLAPECPWPAARDDAARAIAWARSEPGHVLVAGDSAGGGLAIAAAVEAVGAGHDVDAVVAMSPWTDLTLPYATAMDLVEDPQAPRWLLERSAEAYGGRAGARTASPISTAVETLPPTLVQVGSAESLFDDSLAFAARAYARGLTGLELQVWAGMPHVWQAFAPRLAPAQAALDAAGHWVDRRLATSS